jgi:hypothetical protein
VTFLDKYEPEELKRFLQEIDRELTEAVDITIIGGAALCLGYGFRRATRDIDLWENAPKPFWEAVGRVKARTGWTIPVSPTPIAEPRSDFEERLHEYPLEGATQLRVWLPERHDLAMMKAARGEAPDLDAILDLHRTDPLDVETLLQRFPEMMPTGPEWRFRMNFLAMVGVVFGDDVAEEIEARLPARQT